jgi:hypothetical protein
MSWNPEVIADSSGQWVGNGTYFATKAEAEAYLRDLFSRWTLVRETRAVESAEPVNCRWNSEKGHTEVLPEGYFCPLCGQRIDDGKPCGCGARS